MLRRILSIAGVLAVRSARWNLVLPSAPMLDGSFLRREGRSCGV
jgi:hypothetical protein